MKNWTHAIGALLLSMMIFIMGCDVTFVHCHCSGKTSVVLSHAPSQNSQKDNGCMAVESVSLSPTTQVQSSVFDFHAFQPLTAALNAWLPSVLLPQVVVQSQGVRLTREYSPPPRAYLCRLRVLII